MFKRFHAVSIASIAGLLALAATTELMAQCSGGRSGGSGGFSTS